MNTPSHSPVAKTLLYALADAIARGTNPLVWWRKEISPISPNPRRILLLELAELITKEMRGISNIAQFLGVEKKQHPDEFECILYEFLMPLHRILVMKNLWDEALNLELIIYTIFIKQDEDHTFYENSFASLYSPYSNISYTSAGPASCRTLTPRLSGLNESDFDPTTSGGSVLFWFQNYFILAHTQLVLDLASNLSPSAKVYCSALFNTNLDKARTTFAEVGIEILSIDDRKNLSTRCDDLVRICKDHGISNIVFVSLPLQSGYLQSICDGIQLTWWSMKYPLGCMHHFNRLVCNRTLYPTQKKFNGALWSCAPFAVKPVPFNPKKESRHIAFNDLKMGVLSREEKFASSQLPEILHRCLTSNNHSQLFWTGRSQDKDLDRRLHSSYRDKLANRIHFCGWVSPVEFLTQIDLLIDTPNLGGMVAYWMMSMGKVVLSATDYGSVGALGSREDLREHFELLTNPDQVHEYFSSPSDRPFYLSDPDLIPLCIEKYCSDKDLLDEHGRRFFLFFDHVLSDLGRYSQITYRMLQGQYSH
jgi:hypothetical protein